VHCDVVADVHVRGDTQPVIDEQASHESAIVPFGGASLSQKPLEQDVHCEFAAVVQVSSLVQWSISVQSTQASATPCSSR